MSDELIPPKEQPIEDQTGTLVAPPHGLVALQIGTGKNAQTSIVYKTIFWSFLAASGFALLAFGYACWSDGDPLEAIKGVWTLFIPLITLSLGYVFGKAS
ncbi:hypothetical protein [Caballeronia sp. INML1]|uniref:hypothetical protein n=1 Tax=Caballeronia sp. INML1 TaxID=2921760 RepID=UPI002027DFA1|nr:hypothetical protein [Caballeronia sp. INML1]